MQWRVIQGGKRYIYRTYTTSKESSRSSRNYTLRMVLIGKTIWFSHALLCLKTARSMNKNLWKTDVRAVELFRWDANACNNWCQCCRAQSISFSRSRLAGKDGQRVCPLMCRNIPTHTASHKVTHPHTTNSKIRVKQNRRKWSKSE